MGNEEQGSVGRGRKAFLLERLARMASWIIRSVYNPDANSSYPLGEYISIRAELVMFGQNVDAIRMHDKKVLAADWEQCGYIIPNLGEGGGGE